MFSERLPEFDVPEFHGDSYLLLPVSESLSQHTSIEIWFMTMEENGWCLLFLNHWYDCFIWYS